MEHHHHGAPPPAPPLAEAGGGGPAAVAPVFRRLTNSERANVRERKRKREERRVNKAKARLRMLHHASTCTMPSGHCPIPDCADYRLLWQHARTCCERECEVHPQCVAARRLLKHHARCRSRTCPVCEPAQTNLMLYHTSVCRKRIGFCAVPHCADYRLLWRHARACEHRKCQDQDWCEKHPLCVGACRMHDHFAQCGHPECVVCELVVAERQRLLEQQQQQQAPQPGGSVSPAKAQEEDCLLGESVGSSNV